jgi:Kef-type K+ transport system membrane component KefB
VLDIVVKTVNRFGTSPREEILAVHPEHEQALRKYTDNARRFGVLFLVSIGVSVGAGLLLELVLLRMNPAYATIGIGLSVALLGVLVAIFPFATPETIAWIGARASRRTARGVGIVLAAAGIVVASIPAL